MWSCRIPGNPAGKGRPRFAGPKLGRKARTYTPGKTKRWEHAAAQVMSFMWRHPALTGPVAIRVTAVLDRPKRLLRKSSPPGRIYATKKPDWDNVGKIVSDALQLANVLRDDAIVVDGRTVKFYRALDEEPHVLVELEVLAT
jgi:Holliday junction resolvase RusA-like endonuclease